MDEVETKITNLNISVKDTLLESIYQYYTEKGYRFAIGDTVEPVDGFKILGKPFVPTPTALILDFDEEPTDDYTNIRYLNSIKEITAAGRKFLNELIIFTLDTLCEDN